VVEGGLGGVGCEDVGAGGCVRWDILVLVVVVVVVVVVVAVGIGCGTCLWGEGFAIVIVVV